MLRRERARPDVEAHAAADETDETERRSATASLELQRRLFAAIDALSEPYREAIVLRFIEDLSTAEIANRLGCTTDVARQRVSRGVRALRSKLERQPGGRDAWMGCLAATPWGHGGIGATKAAGAIGVGSMGAKTAVGVAAVALLAAALVVSLSLNEVPSDAAASNTSNGGQRSVLTHASHAARAETSTKSGEREAVGETEPSEAKRTHSSLRVLNASGRPIGGARVAFEQRDVVTEAACDGSGVAQLEWSVEPTSGLFVYAEGHAPQRAEPSASSIVLVELVELVDFRARIVEDGRTPDEPLHLRLDPVADLSSSWPERIRAHLGEALDAWRARTAQTDAIGDFCFRGVARTWRGSLKLPSTHWLFDVEQLDAGEATRSWAGPGTQLELSSPEVRGEVHVRRLPTLRGRILLPGGRTPAAHARFSARVRFDDDSLSPESGATADDDGRFSVGFRDASHYGERISMDAARARIRSFVWSFDGGGPGLRTRVERELSDPVESVDLGNIVLRAGRTLRFLALDDSGAPIEGALAFERISGAVSRSPSDSQGRGQLAEIDPLADSIQVGAPGYSIATALLDAATANDDAPLVVRLDAAPLLDVRLVAPSGADLAQYAIRIRGPRELWSGTNSFGPTALHRALARSELDGVWRKDSGVTRASLDERGRVRLAGIAPGEAFELSLENSRHPLVETRVEPALEASEHREVEFRLDAPPFAWRGRVLDVAGAPLAFATVQLVGTFANGTAITDDLGRFSLGEFVLEGASDVEVELNGYAAASIRATPITRAAAPLEIRLDAATTLELHVIETGGASALDLSLTARGDDLKSVSARETSDGRYVFSGLAPRQLVVACERSGRRFEWAVDAAVGETTVELPRHGRLLVELETAGKDKSTAAWRGVVVRALDGEPIEFRVHPRFTSAEGVASSDAAPCLPGRYQVELLVTSDRDRTEQPTGVRADVVIRAGETTTVRLGG